MILHGAWEINKSAPNRSRFVFWMVQTLEEGQFSLLRSQDEVCEAIGEDPNGDEEYCFSIVPYEGSAERLLSILLHMNERLHKEQRSVALGENMQFWMKAAHFVLDLLMSGHYVPSILPFEMTPASGERTFVGGWDPVLEDPAWARRYSELKKSILCIPVHSLSEAPDALACSNACDARDLEHFIHTMVDSYIRETMNDSDRKQLMTVLNPRYIAPLKPTEHWIHSLITPRSDQDLPSLEWISDDILQWRHSLAEKLHQISFRTCFRLEEPQADSESVERNALSVDAEITEMGWRVRVFLQASEDPSLLVPADLLWSHSEDRFEYMNRLFVHPQEKLLQDLDKAASVYEPIARLLRQPTPSECHWTTAEAYSFIMEGAPLLAAEGYGVFIPGWWGRKDAKPGLQLRLQTETAGRYRRSMLGFDAVIQFDWELSLGGERIAREELEQLATLKIPLIRWKGKWVLLKQEDTEGLLSFIQHNHHGKMTMSEAVQLFLGSDELTTANLDMNNTQSPVSISGMLAEGELGQFIERLKHNEMFTVLHDQPDQLNGSLRKYQIKGFSWLLSMRDLQLGACLADDMGLGKTVQWIAYLVHLKQGGGLKGSALLICPTSVIGNWQRELERFAPELNVLTHYGTDRLKGDEWLERIEQYDIVLTSYTTALRDEKMMKSVSWDVITLDEAQNIKNQHAKQTKMIRKLKAYHRVALTGTPVENKLTELWSIMDFLNPGYLGSEQRFIERFAVPIEKQQDEAKTRLLHRIVQPFILRRIKSDKSVLTDLPLKQETKVYCTLTKEQATLYEACVSELFREMERAEGMKRRGLIVRALTHMKQICNHPAHFLGEPLGSGRRSGKLIRLTELVADLLAQGESSLIFTQYAAMAVHLHAYLQQSFNQEVLLLHGKIPRKERDEMIVRFQERSDAPKLFVLSLKTGGFGLNLTKANHVIHYDRWWNPAVENQATDRAYRIGQIRNVHVHKMICMGTLEEQIDQMIESKQALAASVIGKGEGGLTELSTDQLKEIFMLRRHVLLDEEDTTDTARLHNVKKGHERGISKR